MIGAENELVVPRTTVIKMRTKNLSFIFHPPSNKTKSADYLLDTSCRTIPPHRRFDKFPTAGPRGPDNAQGVFLVLLIAVSPTFPHTLGVVEAKGQLAKS